MTPDQHCLGLIHCSPEPNLHHYKHTIVVVHYTRLRHTVLLPQVVTVTLCVAHNHFQVTFAKSSIMNLCRLYSTALYIYWVYMFYFLLHFS